MTTIENRQRAGASLIYFKSWFVEISCLPTATDVRLQDVSNVLIVVTRYYGGILLGPDRFKHINQAARDALELGGFLNGPDPKRSKGSKRERNRTWHLKDLEPGDVWGVSEVTGDWNLDEMLRYTHRWNLGLVGMVVTAGTCTRSTRALCRTPQDFLIGY